MPAAPRKKWSDKNIELSIDFDEYDISANEEMLKQVWINLLDNAIKFTPEYGGIEVNITQNDETTSVSIANTGEKISDSDIDRIFGKFYQGDTSHSSENRLSERGNTLYCSHTALRPKRPLSALRR